MSLLNKAGLQYLWTKLNQKFFPLSGGTVNGDVSVNGTLSADDVSINGVNAFTSRSNFSGNMNSTEILPGIYFCNLSECTGGPATSGYGWLIVYPNSNLQAFVMFNTHVVYVRGYTNRQWYDWTTAGDYLAPTAHASTSATYGLGTTSSYGHVKVVNGLTQSSHSNGNALSAYQGYVLNNKFSNYFPKSGGTLNGDIVTHNVRPFVSANPSQTCNLGSSSYRYGTFFCTGGMNFSANEVSQSDNVLVIKVSNRAHVGNMSLSSLMPIWASDFSTTSSRLVKENITALTEDDARKLLELTPVHFDYKDCVGGKKDQLGLIAEDVLQVIPQVVQVPDGYDESDFDEKKGLFNDLLSLDYSKLVPHLIKMVQIQQQEIDDLKTRLSELKSQRITQTEECP